MRLGMWFLPIQTTHLKHRKIMKIKIPNSSREISLAECQALGQQETIQQKALLFFKDIVKADVSKLPITEMVAAYNVFRNSLDKEMIPDVPKSIGKLNLPARNNLLKLHLQYFIEIVNCEVSVETYQGLEILTACFYREDWSKPYDDEELLTNATWLNSQPLQYNLYGVILMQRLFKTLRDTYPILYTNSGESEDEEEGRKLYDMLNGLAKDDPTKWDAARNLRLETAFAYLEEKKLDFEKKRLNLHNSK